MSTETLELNTIAKAPERRQKAAKHLKQASALFAAEMDSYVIEDPEQCANWFRAQIGFNDDERFAAVFMDQGRRVLQRTLFEEGSRTRCVLYPRHLFATALACNATGIILAHNHPGGSIMPSSQDRELTRRIQDVGQSLEVTLVDHLIVTKEGFAGFRRHGWM